MGFSNITFMSPGKRFQKHRKLLQEYFSRQKVLEYMSFQVGQARVLAIEFAKLEKHESPEHVLERSMPSLADIFIDYRFD
jgi:cytochrome P450